MRVYLPCDGLDCACADHVDTDTHVPCCPLHGDPLVAADKPGFGQCLWTQAPARHLSRIERLTVGFRVKACGSWGPSSWVWKRRDGFHGEDLPPYNGWKPIDVEAALGACPVTGLVECPWHPDGGNHPVTPS